MFIYNIPFMTDYFYSIYIHQNLKMIITTHLSHEQIKYD